MHAIVHHETFSTLDEESRRTAENLLHDFEQSGALDLLPLLVGPFPSLLFFSPFLSCLFLRNRAVW